MGDGGVGNDDGAGIVCAGGCEGCDLDCEIEW